MFCRQPFNYETIYAQDVLFITMKGFTMKLFHLIFLNSVIYKTCLRIQYCALNTIKYYYNYEYLTFTMTNACKYTSILTVHV